MEWKKFKMWRRICREAILERRSIPEGLVVGSGSDDRDHESDIDPKEHLIFSGAKTGESSYYDLIEQIRELTRNQLMQKVIPAYGKAKSGVFRSAFFRRRYRLMEVGAKQQSLGHKAEAYKLV